MNEQNLFFNVGERIITKGGDANAAYLVVSGEARVFLDKDGREVTLARLGPGDIFGETALFGSGQYGAHVEAVSRVELSVITPQAFAERIASSDPMLRGIVEMLMKRLRKTNEALLKSETREFMDIAFV